MPAIRLCEMCKRNPVKSGSKSYCGSDCEKRHRKMLTNLAKIEAGKTCKRCLRPRPHGNDVYCSETCERIDRAAKHCCPVCKAKWTGGTSKTCSTRCASELRRLNDIKLKDAKWQSATFKLPEVDLEIQRVCLLRRPVSTNSGNTRFAMMCWNTFNLAEFPADPKVSTVIWKDGKYIMGMGRKISTVRSALLRLTENEMKLLPEMELQISHFL